MTKERQQQAYAQQRSTIINRDPLFVARAKPNTFERSGTHYSEEEIPTAKDNLSKEDNT